MLVLGAGAGVVAADAIALGVAVPVGEICGIAEPDEPDPPVAVVGGNTVTTPIGVVVGALKSVLDVGPGGMEPLIVGGGVNGAGPTPASAAVLTRVPSGKM